MHLCSVNLIDDRLTMAGAHSQSRVPVCGQMDIQSGFPNKPRLVDAFRIFFAGPMPQVIRWYLTLRLHIHRDGMSLIGPNQSLILVEGYMDAISLHQAGFDNVIACLGTALTSEMAHLLSRYCEEVILSYDADEAGQKATARAIGIFNSIGMKLRVVHLSGGKDPDEILRNYGPERFRSLIEGAANDIEFALVRLKGEFDLATSDGKMKFLERAAEILANTRSKIAQDIYSSRLSEELGVKKESILIRIDQLSRRNARQNEKKQFSLIQQQTVTENTKTAVANDTDIKSIKAQQMLIDAILATKGYCSADEKPRALQKNGK